MSGDSNNIRWVKNLKTVKIGGRTYQRLNSDLSANCEHIGGKEEDCYFCTWYDKKDGVKFQYMYGVIHKREADGWYGYIGNFQVNSMHDDYFKEAFSLG